jgi:hypothetical protein
MIIPELKPAKIELYQVALNPWTYLPSSTFCEEAEAQFYQLSLPLRRF